MPPLAHRLAVEPKGLLQTGHLQPGVVQIGHQQLILRVVTILGDLVEQFTPIIHMNALILLIPVKAERRVTLIGGQQQLQDVVAFHRFRVAEP